MKNKWIKFLLILCLLLFCINYNKNDAIFINYRTYWITMLPKTTNLNVCTHTQKLMHVFLYKVQTSFKAKSQTVRTIQWAVHHSLNMNHEQSFLEHEHEPTVTEPLKYTATQQDILYYKNSISLVYIISAINPFHFYLYIETLTTNIRLIIRHIFHWYASLTLKMIPKFFCMDS